MHPVAHQQHLLGALGIRADGEHLELWPSELDEQGLAHWLRENSLEGTKPLAGLHIGSSERWRTKRWDVERWAALCDHLAQRGYQVILTGTARDREAGERVRASTKARPVMALGTLRLMELACLIRRCQVYVTTDSAPLHLAAAMGTPTVALFGPTDPARHAPRASRLAVIKKDVPCSPCYSTWCRTITHACMKRISVEEVANAVEGLTRHHATADE
jgi:ADP-heptose:LPS heptosyltransferase